MRSLAYAVPLLPLLVRAILTRRFHQSMVEYLPEEAQEREQHRSLILTLAGFSFTGLLALVVLDSALAQRFRLPIFYLLTSFLSYMWALNLQGYKARRWHGSLAVGLVEVGSLSLLLSVIALLWAPTFERSFAAGLSTFACIVWGLDFVLRLTFEYRYLKLKEGALTHGKR